MNIVIASTPVKIIAPTRKTDINLSSSSAYIKGFVSPITLNNVTNTAT